MEILLDNYARSSAETTGDLLGAFKEANEEFCSHYGTVRVNSTQVRFFSVCSVPEVQKPGMVALYDLNEEFIEEFGAGKRKCKVVYYAYGDVPEDLIQECVNTSGLFMSITQGEGDDAKADMYIVSNYAVGKIASESLLGGQSILVPGIIRDMMFASAFYRRHKASGKECTAIVAYRTDTTPTGRIVRKIFSVLSGRYQVVPATCLNSLADTLSHDPELSEGVCERWSIDHIYTRINLSFPKAAEDFKAVYNVDAMPGVQLLTSDTGDASLTARGLIYGKSGYVVVDEVTLRHTGVVDETKLVKAVEDQIFKKVRKLPEALANLMAVDVTGDKTGDDNKKAVEAVVRAGVKEMTAKIKAGGLAINALTDAMVEEINPDLHYTGYDIAQMFIDAPDRMMGCNESVIILVRRAFGQAPYKLYDMLTKDAKLYLA